MYGFCQISQATRDTTSDQRKVTINSDTLNLICSTRDSGIYKFSPLGQCIKSIRLQCN